MHINLFSRRSLKSENIRTCHTAILPSPNAQMEQPWTAIQVKFDLLPPFPPLLPYLALRIPGKNVIKWDKYLSVNLSHHHLMYFGVYLSVSINVYYYLLLGCVVLNTGDRLVALVYETDQPLTPLDSPGSMAYSWLHNQTYSLHSDVGPGMLESVVLCMSMYYGAFDAVNMCRYSCQ